ncbi:MAG: hypothetical protein M1269_06810 [Chloroflexi bacterium]|nr:hypothetical protein [Chloroflexota bacterium]
MPPNQVFRRDSLKKRDLLQRGAALEDLIGKGRISSLMSGKGSKKKNKDSDKLLKKKSRGEKPVLSSNKNGTGFKFAENEKNQKKEFEDPASLLNPGGSENKNPGAPEKSSHGKIVEFPEKIQKYFPKLDEKEQGLPPIVARLLAEAEEQNRLAAEAEEAERDQADPVKPEDPESQAEKFITPEDDAPPGAGQIEIDYEEPEPLQVVRPTMEPDAIIRTLEGGRLPHALKGPPFYLSPSFFSFVADHAFLIYAAYIIWVEGGDLALPALAILLALPFLPQVFRRPWIPTKRPLFVIALCALILILTSRIQSAPLLILSLFLVRLLSSTGKVALIRLDAVRGFKSHFYNVWGAPLVYVVSSLIIAYNPAEPNPSALYITVLVLFLAASLACVKEKVLDLSRWTGIPRHEELKFTGKKTLINMIMSNAAGIGFLTLLCFIISYNYETPVLFGGYYLAVFLLATASGAASWRFMSKLLSGEMAYGLAQFVPALSLLLLFIPESTPVIILMFALSGFFWGLQEKALFSLLRAEFPNKFPEIYSIIQRAVAASLFLWVLVSASLINSKINPDWLALFFMLWMIVSGILEIRRCFRHPDIFMPDAGE